MLAALRHLNDILTGLINMLVCVLLAVMVFLVALQIGGRSMAVSVVWTTELTQYLLVWLTFVGMATVYRSGGHIAVEVFIDRLPLRSRGIERRIVHMLLALFFLLFTAISAEFIWTIRWSRAATIDVSMVWPYLALPVGSALSLLFAMELALTPGGGMSMEHEA